MAWCLLRSKAKELKQAIADGKVDIYELKDMTSKERREYFKQWVSEEDAKQINLEYERKLTQKNYERAMVSWAQKVTGMKKEAKRDLQTRIQNMIKRGEITAENYDQKMDELIAYRLGAELTPEQVSKIVKLSNRVKDTADWQTKKERLEHGLAIVDLDNYAKEISTTIPKTPGKLVGQAIIDVANSSRSIMASSDASFLGNQALLLLPTRQYWQTILGIENGVNIFKQFTKDGYEQVQAYVLTDPNYEIAKKAGLRISNLNSKLSEREETYMSNLADKMPGLGKVITGSEQAYTAFMNQLRMSTFNKWYNLGKQMGEDTRPGSKFVKELAYDINMFTGSADLGRLEEWTPALNTVFFAPRKTASIMQTVVSPITALTQTKTARKMVMSTLLKYFLGYGLLLSLAKMYPDDDLIDAELDPRSVNFLRIKIGKLWLDGSLGIGRLSETAYTGLLGGIYNYLPESLVGEKDSLLFGKKNSETGVITPYGDGQYDTNALKVFLSYGRNKLSPLVGAAVDLASGTDYKGDKVNPARTFANLCMQMNISSIIDLTVDAYNSEISTGSKIASGTETILSSFGMNAYHVTNVPNWHDPKDEDDNEEIKRFRARVTKEQLSAAEQRYGRIYTEELKKLIKTEKYKNTDNDGKKALISKLKKRIRKQVMSQFY